MDFADDAKRETYRLTTFKDFPQHLVSTVDCLLLARGGFYYTGSGDMVQCFSCANIVSAQTFSDPYCQEMHRYINMY